MMYLAALLLFAGIMFLSASVDKIAKQMKRSNDLKEAELRAAGIPLAGGE